MNRSIELVRYRDFDGGLLALELIGGARGEPSVADSGPATPSTTGTAAAVITKTVTEYLNQASPELKDLYHSVEDYCMALGDDVSKKALKNYFAFRRLKNFACVEVHPQTRNLLVYLKVAPDSVRLEEGFSRDVRSIGHFGTGDLELRLRNAEDVERALPLIQRSYEES